MQTYGFNIWPYFSGTCYKGFTDTPEGFYAVYRECFEKIKFEEQRAFDYSEELDDSDNTFRKMPGFGVSTTGLDFVAEF